MGLLFRNIPAERVLRSVDDTPGIVGAGSPTEAGASIFVHPSWEISPELRARTRALEAAGIRGRAIGDCQLIAEDEEFVGALISVDDAVAACESIAECHTLMLIVSSAIDQAQAFWGPKWTFEAVRAQVDLAIEVRDAIVRRHAEEAS